MIGASLVPARNNTTYDLTTLTNTPLTCLNIPIENKGSALMCKTIRHQHSNPGDNPNTVVCWHKHRNHLFAIQLKLESGEDDYASKP